MNSERWLYAPGPGAKLALAIDGRELFPKDLAACLGNRPTI